MFKMQESKTEIFNKGLEISLNLGSESFKPIQNRLHELYPRLTSERLNQVEDTCRQALELGHNLLAQMNNMTPEQLNDRIEDRLTDSYPWISQKNLQRILNGILPGRGPAEQETA